MINSPQDTQSDLYLDFAQFDQLRKMSRDNKEQALHAAAKQMEGIFLNMMMQSMRDANAIFAEGNMLESRDGKFYQGMYDKQLTLNISNNGGIGLADVIVRQMSNASGSERRSDSESVGDIKQYLENRIPARLSTEKTLDSAKNHMVEPQVPVPNDQRSLAWNTPEEFVEVIYPFAEKAAAQLNVEPQAIVAQAVLETGWGKHVMSGHKGDSSFNLFGIKADSRWDGDSTRKNTLEYRNGIAAKENASFRSYSSLDQAFDDYVGFLKTNARYDEVVEQKNEAKQWGFALQEKGYATDPHYGNKIAHIIESDVFQSALQRMKKQI
jgi:flagellar protein FlgJ